MSTLAHDSEDTDIELRIAYLQKAVTSAEKAASYAKNAGRELPPEILLSDESSTELVERRIVTGLVELQDTLDIAGKLSFQL